MCYLQDNLKKSFHSFEVSQTDLERYALRVLLLNVKGATSFNELKTIKAHFYSSFKQAAIALRLFESDQEWILCR